MHVSPGCDFYLANVSSHRICRILQPKYTQANIRLLAAMDERHQQPGGPVLKKFCERACERFDEPKYEHLASISVSHLYNLRQSIPYQRQRCLLTKTRPKAASIGIRRKPCPNETFYLMKVTDYSHAQIKRLIRQYIKKGTITVKTARRNGFKLKYTQADIRLLAAMDERHHQP